MFDVTTGPVVEVQQRPRSASTRGVIAAVELTQHHRTAAAVVDDARLDVVGAEVDERADRALRPTICEITSSFSPFCAETTNPSAVRCGGEARVASSVCCAFVARMIVSHWPSDRIGREGRRRCGELCDGAGDAAAGTCAGRRG